MKLFVQFIQNYDIDLCKENSFSGAHVKFLILAMSVVQELQKMKERTVDRHVKGRAEWDLALLGIENHISFIEPSNIFEKFTKSYTIILVWIVH